MAFLGQCFRGKTGQLAPVVSTSCSKATAKQQDLPQEDTKACCLNKLPSDLPLSTEGEPAQSANFCFLLHMHSRVHCNLQQCNGPDLN